MAEPQVTDLRQRIKTTIMEHSVCMCGEWAENFEEHCDHIAEKVLAVLQLDYSRELCPRNCDCGECYHNPKRDCHCYIDSVAAALDRELDRQIGDLPSRYGEWINTVDLARAAVNAMQSGNGE